MTPLDEHPGDALQELMDGRLEGEERTRVEQHLETCERCRRELELLSWTTRMARSARDVEPVPAELESKLSLALDREDTAAPHGVRRFSVPRFVGLLAAALLVVAVGLFLLERWRGDLPQRFARDFASYRAGDLALEVTAEDVAAVERFFADRSPGFPVRVLDLGMMDYRPVGGRLHRVSGSASALYVYRGPDGRILVCQMYRGRVGDLPPAEERRTHDGIAFRIYEREGKTVVAWQEGDVVCVLVSDIEREQVIQLAFAKAMKV
jgi:anti-sigma factor RsiW